jgi:hypothetical protein
MPKRLMICLAVAALAIAACHSYGNPSPTPTGSPVSPQPNPSVKTARVLVTILGTPTARIPVEESTPRDKQSPRPGTPFETRRTNKNGMARFSHLKPNGVYCWVALLGQGHTSSECASWVIWQTSTIPLGT